MYNIVYFVIYEGKSLGCDVLCHMSGLWDFGLDIKCNYDVYDIEALLPLT